MTDKKVDLFPDAAGPQPPLFYTLPELSSAAVRSSLEQDVKRSIDVDVVQPAPVYPRPGPVPAPVIPVLPGKVTPTDKPQLDLSSFRPDSLIAQTVRKQIAMQQQQLAVVQVPELPVHVEKPTSFVSQSGDPRAVLGAVAQLFDQSKPRVDYEFDATKLKITGVAYENNVACTFKIKVYRHPDKARCIVEFQRRAGCVLSFSAFYRHSVRALGSDVVRCPFLDDPVLNDNAGKSPFPVLSGSGSGLHNLENNSLLASFGSLSLKSDSSSSASSSASASPAQPPSPSAILAQAQSQSQVTLDDATITALLAMAAAKDTVIQREATRAFANASASLTNQLKLVSAAKAKASKDAPAGSPAALISTIGTLLASKDPEVARCAAQWLLNIAQQASIRPQLLVLLPALFAVINAPAPAPAAAAAAAQTQPTANGLIVKETKRLVNKVLSLLTKV